MDQFQHCEHIAGIKNYCNQCTIFLCDDCGMDHLEHLELMDAWDAFVKEYLIKCTNYDHRLKMMLKMQDQDDIKTQLFLKIDTTFDNIIDKINEYRALVKRYVLEHLPKEYMEFIIQGEKIDSKELKELLRKLSVHVSDIHFKEGKDDKEGVIHLLRANFLKEVDATIAKYPEIRSAKTPTNIKKFQFSCTERFTYDLFLPFIDIKPEYLMPPCAKPPKEQPPPFKIDRGIGEGENLHWQPISTPGNLMDMDNARVYESEEFAPLKFIKGILQVGGYPRHFLGLSSKYPLQGPGSIFEDTRPVHQPKMKQTVAPPKKQPRVQRVGGGFEGRGLGYNKKSTGSISASGRTPPRNVYNPYTKKRSEFFDPYIQYGGNSM